MYFFLNLKDTALTDCFNCIFNVNGQKYINLINKSFD